MRKLRLGLTLASIVAAVFMPMAPQPAASFPAPPLTPAAQMELDGGLPDIDLVHSGGHWHGNGGGHWRPPPGGYYNHWHGPRYRYRYPGYNYYYGGFWYGSPWWLNNYNYNYYPAPRSAHVRWCMNRYRTYNPQTNTFRGNDGRLHRCNSPYD